MEKNKLCTICGEEFEVTDYNTTEYCDACHDEESKKLGTRIFNLTMALGDILESKGKLTIYETKIIIKDLERVANKLKSHIKRGE